MRKQHSNLLHGTHPSGNATHTTDSSYLAFSLTVFTRCIGEYKSEALHMTRGTISTGNKNVLALDFNTYGAHGECHYFHCSYSRWLV